MVHDSYNVPEPPQSPEENTQRPSMEEDGDVQFERWRERQWELDLEQRELGRQGPESTTEETV